MGPRILPRQLFLFAALTIAVAGCGGAGSSGPARGSSTLIVTEELETVAQQDLYTAISRLRPTWLRPGSRGTLPGVIVDGTPQAGAVDALRSFRAADVGEVRFMNSSDATTRYGTGYTAGAIVVTTRR